MCKMDSSADSESEISPRWSDTSTLGCVSRASESRTSRRTLSLAYKSAGRHACCSLFLDPYDGSSEDSDESNVATCRQTRHHGKGGSGLSGQRRRPSLHYSLRVGETVTNTTRDSSAHQCMVHRDANEVRMKCDSELWDGKGCRSVNYPTKGVHPMDVEVQLDDSGLEATRSSTCCSPGLPAPEERRSLRTLCKRKELPPEAEPSETEPRKRQCVKTMEDKRDETE